MSPRLATFLQAFCLLALGVAVYSNTLNSSFHFDDMYYIVHKPAIRDLSDLRAIWNAYYGLPLRAVAFLTFALNYHIHHLDVTGYHLLNIAIHILTAFLVGWLLRLTCTTPRMRTSPLKKHQSALAFFAALLFLVHPVQTQAVTYISQRFASLATLFYLAALCFYVKGRMGRGGSWQQGMNYGIAFLSGLLGMFTKQTVLTLPLMVILYELFFFRGKGIERPRLKPSSLTLILVLAGFLLVIPGLYSFDALGILKMRVESGSHPGDVLTARTYLMTQFRVIVTYMRLLLFPVNQNLLYDYPASKSLFEVRTLTSLILIVGFLVWALKLFRRYRIMAFGIVWFFVTLSVESSVIVIKHVIFEHRIYLPSVGFCLFAAAGLFAVFKDIKKLYIAMGLIVLTMSLLAFQRNTVWRDEVTLWRDVVKKSPDLARPYVNLGAAYIDLDFEQALRNFNKALSIDPDQVKAYNNRGLLFNRQGLIDSALTDFNKGIELEPGRAELYNNRADVYEKKGEYELALKDYHRALRINPQYAEAYVNRGVLHGKRGRFGLSIADFTRAIEIHPSLAQAYNNRAVVYLEQKKFERAKEDLDRAIRFKKNYPDAYYNRANAYRGLKDYPSAIRDYSRAIKIKEDYAPAYNNRGIVYGMIGRYDLALDNFTQAIRLDPDYAAAYFNRGLAYKQRGEDHKALDDILKARSLGKRVPAGYLQKLKELSR